ncbi:MAG: phosphatidylglycerol lysyltransferase domain-containing protein [Elusimicrobiota bacterium]|jgi:phosphatidylglycerol lysyltransferase|nr:phosphatidylglycerol lysyltransferase domain-containing protein [Elusimicrobiota bacterium]
MKKWFKFILVPIGLLIFIGALVLLREQVSSLSFDQIQEALSSISIWRILLAMCLALTYYLLLGGYDIIAYKYIDPKVPMSARDIFFTCFISNALGNNTGYSMLFGGSLRYRLYSIHNIPMLTVTKVLFFSSATIWLGLLTIGAVVFTFTPVSFSEISGHNISSRIVGIIFLVVLCVYVFASLANIKSFSIFNKKISFPNIKIVAWQISLATLDWLVASFTLWALMPHADIPYFVLLKVFLISQLLGIISQVPGGMGVFEASIAILLPQAASNPEVIGGLLAYRAIFYFFPLSVALFMLFSYESLHFIKRIDEKTKMIGKAFSSVIVQALSVLTFFAGMLSMFIVAVDLGLEHAKLVGQWLFNVSHIILAFAATLLLFISRALQLRIAVSYKITCALLIVVTVLSVVIGKFAICGIYFVLLFVVFLHSKQYFYRTRSMLNLPFSAWWYIATFAIFFLFVWMGSFINKANLFAQLATNGILETFLSADNAGRFMRAAAASGIVFVFVVFDRLIRNPMGFRPQNLAKKDVLKILNEHARYTYDYMALSPDKKALANKSKTAFIMYENISNLAFALSDPIGPESQKPELIWEFKENAERKSEEIAFIGIDKKYIRFYKDIELDIFPIGKAAKIFLPKFDPKGSFFKSIISDVEKSGIKYETILPTSPSQIKEQIWPFFDRINFQDNFVKIKFLSGGYDKNRYLANPHSVLKKDGEVFAFSVLEQTQNKNDFSSGLIYFDKFDYEQFVFMLYKNCLYAKEKGFKWFDLGVTYFKPAGEDQKDIIKHFAKLFSYAQYFKGDLESLHKIKEKFNPVWLEKFVAIDSNININLFLKSFASLIKPQKEMSALEFFKRFFSR